MIGVMRPYVAETLAGTTWLDEEIHYQPRAELEQLRPNSRRRPGPRTARPDVAVLLTNSLRTGWMAWRSGARERIGTARHLRSLLINTRVADTGAPTIDAYLNLAYATGCTKESPRLELATTPEDEAAADAVWRMLRLPEMGRVAMLNSGGAFGRRRHGPPSTLPRSPAASPTNTICTCW